jgi:hypothetical protein
LNGDTFGSAVAINDTYAIVGGGGYEGAVHIYKMNRIWSFLRKEIDTMSQRNHFGRHLAIDDESTYMNSAVLQR